MSSYAVQMQGITKIFSNVKANDNVNFTLKKGSIHGLLGENGAGKTTLMNVLYGLYLQEQGDVFINGKREVIDSPTKAISLGIGMVHQHFMLAKPLSVVENIMLGHKSSRGMLLDTKVVEKKLKKLSEQYNLKVDPAAKIWQLSVGEQQRVEILSTIYQGAEILILDEPTAVLTPQEAQSLFGILKRMKDDGKSIILITHKLEEILSVADEVTVLRDGQLIGTKQIDDSTTKEELTRMMVGREVLFDFKQGKTKTGKMMLKIQDACANSDKRIPALRQFSLDIHEGEIIGLAGVDGNGQKELAEVITGIRPMTSGNVVLDGQNISSKSALNIIDAGIAYIPEDRHHIGLAMGFTIAKNFILKTYHKKPFARNFMLNEKEINKNAASIIKKYQIKANSKDDIVKDLSGGNQQKVILGRELSSNPKVLVAAHPTRGLDVGAMQYVRDQIMQARNSGTAVLLISADLEEILQLADRIAVIYDGQLMGILPGGSDIERIGMLMMGNKQEVVNG